MEPELQFLAAVSHEIRNPMTSILGFTEVLLRDYLLPPENLETLESCRETLKHCKETMEIVHHNAEFLLSILNDVLDFSKLEAGKLSVEKINFPLRPFLDDLTALFSIQAMAKNLAFSVDVLTSLPENINTDPIRLRQILVNLIGNAVKFTAQGEIVVSISWVPDKGNLYFAIKDTGIGIASEQLSLLFVPFHQAENSIAKHFDGSGLGLAISKQLIRLLGGDIKVESQEERGSTFTVVLPQQFDGDSHFVQLHHSPQKHFNEVVDFPLTGRKILLVEDSKDTQRLFSFILKKAGAEIITANDGKTALNIVTEQLQNGISFDMILMDAEMPIMDGYTATRRLRDSGYTKPIVALTAYTLQEEHQKFRDAGCSGYITKPILRDALIVAVLKNFAR